MSFTITGPGLYRTRDGRRAEVVESASTLSGEPYWLGSIEHYGGVGWYVNGRESNDEERRIDLIARWEEPEAATTLTPTPHHRTEQFRAETARMFMMGVPSEPMSKQDVVAFAVSLADALIAALEKPQPNTP